jgi:hypothetical protein
MWKNSSIKSVNINSINSIYRINLYYYFKYKFSLENYKDINESLENVEHIAILSEGVELIALKEASVIIPFDPSMHKKSKVSKTQMNGFKKNKVEIV